jgi:hypothetical protein
MDNMSEGEYKTVIHLIVDSKGKLAGLLGDMDDEGCPVTFTPSTDLISAIRLFLYQKSMETGDIFDEHSIYQLILERLDMAYAKLIEVIEK